MNIEIDRSLFVFQLKTLLANKMSMGMLLFWHWTLGGFAFAKKGVAAGIAPDAVLWTNYGLFLGTCLVAMMAAICVSFTLVKPRAYGMVELLLASPLSLRKFAATSFATCFSFSAVNLALHFLVVKLRFGYAPAGAGFYWALAAVLAFAAFILFGIVIMSLRRKDADQLYILLVGIGMGTYAPAMFTKLRLDIAAWLPPALAAVFLLGAAALWFYFHKLISKEKAVLV